MKYCSKCKQIKPVTDFYKNGCKKDGFSDYCKVCANEQDLKRYNSRKRIHPTYSNCPHCGSSKIRYRSRTKDSICDECKIVVSKKKAGVLY